MKTVTFKELNTQSMVGAKFMVSGSETVYRFDTLQLPRNNQFTALNTRFNTSSKIGLQAKLILVK